MMLGPTLATLCFSGVLCVSAYAQQPVPVDDVASFLNDLRAAVDERATGFASGEESLSKGNYGQAEEIFKKLMAQDRGTGAIEGLARVYVAENRPDEALSFLEKQVAQKPSRPDILFAFVRLAAEFHAFDPAITALRKAEICVRWMRVLLSNWHVFSAPLGKNRKPLIYTARYLASTLATASLCFASQRSCLSLTETSMLPGPLRSWQRNNCRIAQTRPILSVGST
jgi:tetratricopeptide (TPR) repeat protein